MMKRKPQLALLSAISGFLILFTACTSAPQKDNELSSAEKEQGFKLLFDGKSMDGWHLYNQGKIASVWNAKNGELECQAGGTDAVHGDLLTDSEYENFEFKFDWKVTEQGNSGVFFNVAEKPELPTAWASGPEYQILEEGHHDQANEKKRAGCLYNFSPQLNTAKLKPLGEWNHSVIRQKDGKIEFELNGIITAKQDLKSEEWKKAIQESNFKNFPQFSKQTKGHLALQDWNKGISFKNLKIREI